MPEVFCRCIYWIREPQLCITIGYDSGMIELCLLQWGVSFICESISWSDCRNQENKKWYACLFRDGGTIEKGSCFFFYCFCFILFPVVQIKYYNTNNLREKTFILAARTCDNWSHHIHKQWAESNECLCSVHFLFSKQTKIPSQGIFLLKMGVHSSVKIMKLLPHKHVQVVPDFIKLTTEINITFKLNFLQPLRKK